MAEENFTPNSDQEAYSAEIKNDFPTSHEPDMADERTAADYAYGTQILGLDKLAALDFAQLEESNRAVDEVYEKINNNAERELEAFLTTGDQKWIEFWSTQKEESKLLKDYTKIKDKEYQKKYGDDPNPSFTAQEESDELNEFVRMRKDQRKEAIESFFESRPNGVQERARYQEYCAKINLDPTFDDSQDNALEAIRMPIIEAIENL